LGIDADTVDGEHAANIVTDARVKAHFPDTIANVLSDHNKAVHDALNIDADTLDGKHASELDHGELVGLADDDHSQYYNAARHTKAIHDALNIDADTVDGSHASDFALASHDHDSRYYTETELNTSGAGGAVHWDNVTNTPSTYTPSSHTHPGSDITSQVGDADSVDGYHLDQDVRTVSIPTFDDLILSSPSSIYNLSHNSFANYVGNEHIDHTSVSISAGTGLTGGGDISTSRTLSLSHLGIENLSDPNANRLMLWDDTDGAVKWVTVGSGLTYDHATYTLSSTGGTDSKVAVDSGATPDYIGNSDLNGVLRTNSPITYTDGGDYITLGVDVAAIDHDSLSGVIANEHVDHSTVLISAGTGLTGGGDITANRTLSLSHLGIENLTDPNSNRLMLWDDTDNSVKWVTIGSGLTYDHATYTLSSSGGSDTKVAVDSAATADYLGNSDIDGVLRTNSPITYSDDGDYITLGINVGAIDHDSLSGFIANEHINHSSVLISAGTGLTGGGDITANRTLSLSHLGIENLSDPGDDRLMLWDDTDNAVKWVIVGSGLTYDHATYTLSSSGGSDVKAAVDSGATADYVGANFDDGFLRIDYGALTWFDGGDYVKIGFDETQIDHNNLNNYVANEHIDWTNAFDNLSTTGSVTCNNLSIYDSSLTNYLTIMWDEESTYNRYLYLYGFAGGSRSLTLNENFTIGSGDEGTLTFNTVATLTVEASSNVNQDLTTDADVTFNGITTTDLTVNTDTLYVDSGLGYVGIGTAYPENIFHIQGADGVHVPVRHHCHSSTNWHSASYQARKSRGTQASPSAVQSGDGLFSFDIFAYDGSGYERAATFLATMQSNPTDVGDIVPAKWVWRTCDTSGAVANRFEVQSDGIIKMNFSNAPSGSLDLEIQDAGTAGATYEAWIQVKVGTTTCYIPCLSSK